MAKSCSQQEDLRDRGVALEIARAGRGRSLVVKVMSDGDVTEQLAPEGVTPDASTCEVQQHAKR